MREFDVRKEDTVIQRNLCLFLLLVPPGILRAVTSTDNLALAPLVEEARRKNPEILAAQKRYEAAREHPSQVSSLPDPMLTFGYTSVGTPRPVAGIGTDPMADAGVMVSQEFPWPGKRKLRGEIAAREADAEFQRYQAVELNVIARLKQAYTRLDYTYEAAAVLERNRDLLRTLLQVAESRYSVGKTAQQDLFKAQVQLSILETRLERLGQERRSFEAEINTLLARAPDSPLGRPAQVPVSELTVTADELYKRAEVNSPLLRQQDIEIKKTGLALNLARKEYRPDYVVSAGYRNAASMPARYEFSVGFKLPVYFRRKQRAAVTEQQINLDRAARDLDAAGRTVHLQLTDAYLMAQTSRRLMRMYADTVIPQAKLTLESSLTAYQTGSVDFLNVLSNFMTAVEYEDNYQQEALGYQLALVQLEEITGSPLTGSQEGS